MLIKIVQQFQTPYIREGRR